MESRFCARGLTPNNWKEEEQGRAAFACSAPYSYDNAVCSVPMIALGANGQEMIQEPKIIELAQTKLVGMSQEMSRINDKTAELWRSFMERRHEVADRSDQNFISMQVFPGGPSQLSDPAATFTKWAVVEVDRLPPDYDARDPDAREEIWIPVKMRDQPSTATFGRE